MIKVNGLSYGLTLTAFKPGYSATSNEVWVNYFTSLDFSFIYKIGTVLPIQTMIVLM